MGLLVNHVATNTQVAILAQDKIEDLKTQKRNERERYTIVQKIEDNPGSPLYNTCARNGQMGGWAMSVVPYERDNVLAIARVSHYGFKNTSCDIKVADMKIAQYNITYNDSFIEQHIAQLALYSAFSPSQRAKGIYDILNLRHIKMLLSIATNSVRSVYTTNKELIAIRERVIKQMIEKKENKLNHIDKEHVQLLFSSANVSDTHNLHPYINSVYVNIVHNCTMICAQTALSDSHEFMSIRAIKKHGKICANKLQALKTMPFISLDTLNVTAHNALDITAISTTHGATTTFMPHNTTRLLTEKRLVYDQNACTTCTLSVPHLAISIAVTASSCISLLVAHSDHKCARAIRSYLAQIVCATTGMRHAQSVNEEHNVVNTENRAETLMHI